MDDGERKWGLALLLACPACVGGVFLGLGAVVGLTAAAVKGLAALAVGGIVAGLWARNAWLRRHEGTACPLPQAQCAGPNPPGDPQSGPRRSP